MNNQLRPPMGPEPISPDMAAEMQAGVRVWINPDSALETPEQVSEKYGLGFSASLRGVAYLGAQDELYIFDRGEHPTDSAFADTSASKTNVFVPREDRYVIITSRGLELAKEAHDNDWSVKRRLGWQGFKAGQTIELGRNPDTEDLLADKFRQTTSRRHLEVVLGQHGEIGVTDLGSTNGTKILTSQESSHPMRAVESKDVEITSGEAAADRSVDMTSAIPLGSLVTEASQRAQEIIGRSKEVGLARSEVKGEDTELINEAVSLYGVFDGMGGHAGGKDASRLAAQEVNSYIDRLLSEKRRQGTQPDLKEVLDAMRGALHKAHEQIQEQFPDAGTTATIAMIQEQAGKRYAVWASVADSRMYIFNEQSQKLVQVTKDEVAIDDAGNEIPYMVTNCLGAGNNLRVKQFGGIELTAGDKVILCSDGITGDYEPDTLQPEEIVEAMKAADGNNQRAADNLLRIARKHDDKTAMVIG